MHTSTKLQYTPHQFVQCDEVSGLLWDGCRKQSNWIIILIVKYKVGIRIRVHSTYLQSSKSSSCKLEASSALNSLRLFPLSKSALKVLSKQLPTTMMMSSWCLDCLATVETYIVRLWRLSIRTSSCAGGKIQCRLLILFYLCLNVPSGNLCREAVLVLAGLC